MHAIHDDMARRRKRVGPRSYFFRVAVQSAAEHLGGRHECAAAARIDDSRRLGAAEPRAELRRCYGARFHCWLILIEWPIAFQPEWPLFMYFASKPASRSLIAVLQPT